MSRFCPLSTTKSSFLGRVLTAVAIILIAVSVSGTEVIPIPIKKRGTGPLFQIHYGAHWGYMNRRGKIVISPRFDEEGDFLSGLAKIRMNKKWGYVDETGRIAIQPEFDDAGDFDYS